MPALIPTHPQQSAGYFARQLMHALVQGAFEHEPKHATNAGAHVLCVAGVQWQAVSVHVKSAPMKTDSFASVTCELANVTPPRGGSSKPLATAALTSCHT
jgi:hypothetical protein|eukprot:COSAG06_NODE_7978_length_2313_cov_1.812556_2_plen_100_part_00